MTTWNREPINPGLKTIPMELGSFLVSHNFLKLPKNVAPIL